MCGDKRETFEDLFNPLNVGFQLLKKGFCLIFDNQGVDSQKFHKYPNQTKDLPSTNITRLKETIGKKYRKNIEPPFDLSKFTSTSSQFNSSRPYEPMIKSESENVKTYYDFPSVLPSGNCLFKSQRIKYMKNAKVTCYDSSQNSQGSKEFISQFTSDTLNQNIFTYITVTFYLLDGKGFEGKQDYYIYSDPGSAVTGTTYEVKFISREYTTTTDSPPIDYLPLSGNPGYILSKPIIIRDPRAGENTIGVYKSLRVIPICSSTNSTYYDPVIDNSFTFESGIIYGCLTLGEFTKIDSEMTKYSGTEYLISPIGKWNLTETKLKKCSLSLISTGENNIFAMNLFYSKQGAVNNTQNEIEDCLYRPISQSSTVSPRYLKINFFRVSDPKKKWWYAPGPGFIKLPRNIMYPFRVGTTTYKKS